MSNAKKKDPQRQLRRQRALSRFTTRSRRADESEAAYTSYVERKELELEALAQRLGVPR